MFDYDAIIIGGGPAGLTAGLYLSRAKQRTILLDKESFGGYIKNVEWIENYPGFADGVSGAQLGSEMVTQATKYGLQMEHAEVAGIELFSSCKWVTCIDGKGYTAAVVIIAGGSQHKKLGVPGEEEFLGKGVSYCALCDGGQFVDRVVAVCGGGDAAITEALQLSKYASRIIVIHRRNQLRATSILQEKAFAEPRIEFLWDTIVEEIVGETSVNRVKVRNVTTEQESALDVSGVFVSIGFMPNTDYLKGILTLDDNDAIVTNDRMETQIPGILAAGNIRSGSPRQIATAVGDGATAAISAQRLLQELA